MSLPGTKGGPLLYASSLVLGEFGSFWTIGYNTSEPADSCGPWLFSFAPPGMLPEAFPPQPSAYSSLSSLDMDILQHFFTRVTNR